MILCTPFVGAHMECFGRGVHEVYFVLGDEGYEARCKMALSVGGFLRDCVFKYDVAFFNA